MSSGKNVALRLFVGFLTLTCLTAWGTQVQGAEWYVSPSGTAGGAGTQVSPWDLQTALHGPAAVHPGDTIWVRGGNYVPANHEYFIMDHLRGQDGAPIRLRAYPGERATLTYWFRTAIDGVSPANLSPGPGYVWIQDLEFTGSIMDGVTLTNGDYVKLINCIVHNNTGGDGIGDWTYGPTNNRYGNRWSELYGNISYSNGYNGPDRWHGHGIYSENNPGIGTKTFSNNILHTMGLGCDGQFTLHLYGQASDTWNYVVTQNIAYDSYGWLMGSTRPADNLQMLGNFISNVTNVWFGNPWSPDNSNTNGVVQDNVILNPYLGLWLYHWVNYTASNNQVVYSPGGDQTYNYGYAIEPVSGPPVQRSYTPKTPWPTGSRIVLLPNQYDLNRANLVIYNWDHAANVSVSLSPVVSAGQPYQLYDPMNMFGTPVQSGTYTGTPISVAMSLKEFVVYVLKFQGQPSNQAPVVYAGLDQTIHQPVTSVTLAGTVSDDGLPPSAAVTSTWSVTSGPGSVTFGNVNAPATTASFSALGTYVLRLTAGDTALSGYDEVRIISAGPVPNQAPVVNAGADKVIYQPANSVSLAGAISDDGLPTGQPVTATWTKTSGPGTVTFANANAASTTATFSTLGTYVLRLTASDTALAAYDECQVAVLVPGTLTMILHLPFDEGAGTVAADTSGNGRNGTLATGATWTTGKTGSAVLFDEVAGQVTVPDFPLTNAFSVAFWFKPTDNTGTAYQYLFNWGSIPSPGNHDNINVLLVENSEGTSFARNLRTFVTDSTGAYHETLDINDPNTYLDGNWHHYCLTVASGQGAKVYLDGTFRIGDVALGGAAIDPNSNLFIGARSDGNNNRRFGGAIDDVRIYNSALTAADVQALFNPVVNAAPTANAGVDHKVMMPYGTALTGSMSDDGLPSPPAACTAAWSKVSGPGTVTFGNPAAAATTATFSTAGTYVLRLTAGDSALSGMDDVTIIVLKAGDFTGDGKVDGLDFLNWQAHYPNMIGGATCDGGDATNDGLVDGRDFLVWQANYHP